MAFSCEHLTKTFETGGDRVLALEDVTFSVGEREFVSIVGPSGCGKTTLLGRTVSPFSPMPSFIGKCLVRQLSSGELGRTLMATFGRIGWGFLLGGIPALFLGLLMGFSPRIRAVADPLVQTMRIEELYASLAVISLIGVGFNEALVTLERRLVPWHFSPEI